MTTQRELRAAATDLGALLQKRGLQIVFAESCTGGLVSAMLAAIPGISTQHCGSAVVYQVDTKARWLGVPARLLENPGPVSREVAIEMAARVLLKTPQAGVAASVTGHLGPDAPPTQDGLIYVAVAIREKPGDKAESRIVVKKHWLDGKEDRSKRSLSAARLRIRRQSTAALYTLEAARSVLEKRFR